MFRDLIRSAVNDIAEHIANEPLSINGQPLTGRIVDETVTSGGGTVDVISQNARVDIRTLDADRIGLTEGMDVEYRGVRRAVRDFSHDNYGWTTIEIS